MQQKVFDKTFITFAMVGVVNTLFGTAIMFVFYNFLGCSYWVSSFFDYFLGGILKHREVCTEHRGVLLDSL